MWATLRNTRSRGRSGVPAMRLRWRSAILIRRSFLVLIFIGLLRPRLAGLLLQHFAGIADALLLVGVRLAHRADVGGHLPDQLAVDAGHGDVRLLVDGHV